MQVDQSSIFNSSVTVIAPTGQSASLWTSTSASTPHLYVKTDGLIGMGTASPGARLDVKATGSTSTNYAQIWRNASNTIVSSMSATGVLTPSQSCTQLTGYPSHAVIFTISACPAGWNQIAPGRFLVGLPSGGSLAGTQGTALSNLEDRPIGQHNHPVNDGGHSHAGEVWDASQCCFYAGSGTFDMDNTGSNTGGSGTGIANTDYYGANGTNVPFIQVRICEKP